MTDRIYPYLCEGPHVDVTGTGATKDTIGHGSLIAAIVTSGLDSTQYCIQVIKWTNTETSTPGVLAAAIRAAADYKPAIMNVSVSGLAGPNFEELSALRGAIARGVTVVVAAGNNNTGLGSQCVAFPACYSLDNNLFHVVSASTFGYRAPYSNYGGPVTDTEDGSYIFKDREWTGTSVATAKVTNRIAKQRGHLKSRQ